jgi:hypothetical protein
MYCSCSNKKKVVTTIASNRVEVCSKNLGGCGKEIGYSYQHGYPYTGKKAISLDRSMIGKRFKTRNGEVVKLIQFVESDNYPCIFEMSDMSISTTTLNGKYSLTDEHKYDIVEML